MHSRAIYGWSCGGSISAAQKATIEACWIPPKGWPRFGTRPKLWSAGIAMVAAVNGRQDAFGHTLGSSLH
jgi:hypothetical protein